MKQPIAGIAGLKPRTPKQGKGKLSKAESRALDREYRVQRNETLRLKNFRETMLLAKARGELIETRLVQLQASFLLTALRRRALALPQPYCDRLAATGDPLVVKAILDACRHAPNEVFDTRGYNRALAYLKARPAAMHNKKAAAPGRAFRGRA